MAPPARGSSRLGGRRRGGGARRMRCQPCTVHGASGSIEVASLPATRGRPASPPAPGGARLGALGVASVGPSPPVAMWHSCAVHGELERGPGGWSCPRCERRLALGRAGRHGCRVSRTRCAAHWHWVGKPVQERMAPLFGAPCTRATIRRAFADAERLRYEVAAAADKWPIGWSLPAAARCAPAELLVHAEWRARGPALAQEVRGAAAARNPTWTTSPPPGN